MRTMAAIVFSITLLACSEKEPKKGGPGSPPPTETKHGQRVDLAVSGFNGGPAKASSEQPYNSPTIAQEYVGIGLHVGLAVVEGLRIRLSGVALYGSKQTMEANIGGWTEPQELEVAKGFNQAITGSGIINSGAYEKVSVQIKPNFDLKAWAYLDRDYDGVVDYTQWTTAGGVTFATQKLSPQEMTGYDYFHYDFLYPGMPNDKDMGESTPVNFELKDTDATAIQIDLRLDTQQIALAWDGEPGYGVDWSLFKTTGAFPEGTPAFTIGYLPFFALVNDSDGAAETYGFSTQDDFAYDYTQLGTILFSGKGEPIVGRMRIFGGVGLHIGQFLTDFTPETDGTLSIYSSNPHEGGETIPQASDKVMGFQRMAVGATPVTVTVEDGAGCAIAALNLDCRGSRSGFAKRVQRD